MNAYQRVKKWRQDNPEKYKLQWEKRYRENKQKILAKKREVYNLKKIINEEIETVLQEKCNK